MARDPGTAPWSRAARRCRTPPVRAGRAGGCGRGARLWRMAAFSTEPRRRRDGRAAGSLHAERKGRAGRAASRQAPRVASGHNARFRAGRYLRARQRLCVEAQCRYRRSRQDRTTPRGDHRPGSRLPSCSASKQSSASRGDDPANRSEPFACPGYLGARLDPGQSGLGDATAGRHRSIYASGVKPGIEAIIRVPAMPNLTFHGKVTRIADALQPGTRTLLTEVDIPNPDGALQPGVYCTVELRIPRQSPSLIVPASAIIFNQSGMQVAVVEDGVAHLHKIAITADNGTEVEVNDGIKDGDKLILQPPVNLADGNKVQIIQIGRASC